MGSVIHNSIRMKTGIIFDLDGTLWNATKQIAESWNVVFERYDDIDLRLTTKELEQQMGKLMETIADDLLPNIPVERRYKILQECCDYENDYLLIQVCCTLTLKIYLRN